MINNPQRMKKLLFIVLLFIHGSAFSQELNISDLEKLSSFYDYDVFLSQKGFHLSDFSSDTTYTMFEDSLIVETKNVKETYSIFLGDFISQVSLNYSELNPEDLGSKSALFMNMYVAHVVDFNWFDKIKVSASKNGYSYSKSNVYGNVHAIYYTKKISEYQFYELSFRTQKEDDGASYWILLFLKNS